MSGQSSPKRPVRRVAASPASAQPVGERGRRAQAAWVPEPDPVEDAVEVKVEDGEEIAELAEIGDDDEEIIPTPSVPEEEEPEW